MAAIQLSKTGRKYNHLFTFIDDEDFERVNKYNWSADNHKHTFYAKCFIDGKLTYLHTFLTGFDEVDHIDRNGLNNTKSNLRSVTRQQNMVNKIKQKGKYTSIFKGVYYEKRRSHWVSRIVVNDRCIYIGSFSSEKLASDAYIKKEKELYGNFVIT